jgi:hypothetical protein
MATTSSAFSPDISSIYSRKIRRRMDKPWWEEAWASVYSFLAWSPWAWFIFIGVGCLLGAFIGIKIVLGITLFLALAFAVLAAVGRMK